MTRKNVAICPSCQQAAMKIFHEVDRVPSNSCILMDSPSEAREYPRGAIKLGWCSECEFISNTSFDARLTEYSGRYEETQGFSGTFNRFHRQLAERLIGKYDLRGKDILEIGCGKGEFITLLSELGENRGVGFDPAYREDRKIDGAAGRVRFVKDFFSEEYAVDGADFVCCKMTLEHIHHVGDFVGMIRRSIGERGDTVVFFQIPDVTRILQECAFEDIYYEHCSYFSPGSLTRLFIGSNFEVLAVDSEFDGQYLTIEARPAAAGRSEAGSFQAADFPPIRDWVGSFSERYEQKLQGWSRRMESWAEEKKRVVLWGSGSKGVAFLTTLGIEDQIEHVVDINPYRPGHYMPGTGQLIVAPEFLAEYRPDVVIVMNAIYTTEIGESLDRLGVPAQVVAI